MRKLRNANCVPIRNIGYLIIFGGCYGLGGVAKGSSAGSSDDWLWDDTGSLPSKYALQYSNESANSVDNSYIYNDPITAVAGAGATTSEDAYGSDSNASVVPVWVVILVGSWWNFGGAMQVCRTHVAYHALCMFWILLCKTCH
eukprot:COSAG02_NODE_11194_length_1773_cov_1.493429_1_plen_143_part_00